VPIEIRSMGVVVLLAALAPAIVVAWPNFCWMPAVALIALTLGLVLPTTPTFNAVGGLLAGVLVLATAVTKIDCGALILVALPLTMAGLRLGARGLVWGWVSGLITLAALAPSPCSMPAYSGGTVDFAALTLVVGWLMWNVGLFGRAAFLRRRLEADLAGSGHLQLGDRGIYRLSNRLVDAAAVLLSIAALPWVVEGNLMTVALYVGFVAWNHHRVATYATLVETLGEAANHRRRRETAGEGEQ
jgi:hypothetical protein